MSRRFAGCGLGRRSARQCAVALAASAPTFASIFGADLQREYDPYYSTIATKGAGVSSFGANGPDPLTLLQASGPAQPAHNDNGLASYVTGDGTAGSLVSGAGTDLAGGDLTIVAVVRKLATPGSTGVIFGIGTNTTVRAQLRITTGGVIDGVIRDSVGSDIMASAISDTTLFHTVVLYNDVGARRCLWVDGGAGVNGVRTTATSTAHTHSTMFSDMVGTSRANASVAYVGVLKNSPTIAKINEWAAAAAVRFAPLGLAAWSTAS
jgi:hypothetical protein